MFSRSVRVILWRLGWKLYTLADKWAARDNHMDTVDMWECGLDLLEKHTGCKCLRTRWPDGTTTETKK